MPKDYARLALNKVMLGELIDLISGIAMQEGADRSRDILGRVYEYFLAGFAGAEGKRGGEFYTPRSVVRLLVKMLEPYKGRVYDPCCGSGGMFVQSERFVEEHGGRRGDIAIYGQESNYTTWRLARMNLAVRGIDADIRWNNEGSFHRDALPDLRADFVLANPPFNISDWGGERLRDDARWQYGVPPAGNANYAWLQHIVHHLSPTGTAGVVLANGSISSQQSGEGDIRRAMLEGDVVDCMVALPPQLFYSTQIPACLWFLARDKRPDQKGGRKGARDRRGEVLFIDARKLGHLVDRTRREFSLDDIDRIAGAYHAWRGQPSDVGRVSASARNPTTADAGNDAHPDPNDPGVGRVSPPGHNSTPDVGPGAENVGLRCANPTYEDVPGFCKAAGLDEIRGHDHVLTPGRYVGAAAVEDDGTPFPERFTGLKAKLDEQLAEGEELGALIQANLEGVVVDG